MYSSSHLAHIDLRVSDGHLNSLFTPALPGELITSVEDVEHEYIRSLVTTREITWIDSRFPKRPLFGYCHNRNNDRSLQSLTWQRSSESMTLLTSKRHGLVSVFDVSRSATSELCHLYEEPYNLPLFHDAQTDNSGYVLTKHPYGNDFNASLFQLGNRGQVQRMSLALDEAMIPPVQWSEEMESLGIKYHNVKGSAGPLGAAEMSMFDMAPVYKSKYLLLHPLTKRFVFGRRRFEGPE